MTSKPTGGDSRVAFCFGVARRTELPGPVLVRMLVDLGVEPAAARSRLARLVARGSLAATRRGRVTDYRLVGTFLAAYQRSDRRAVAPEWDGHLHGLLVTVAEHHRSFRDAFRRQAVQAGYGQLRPGLLIAPEDRSAPLADLMARTPDDAGVLPVRLQMDPDAVRVAAAEAWDLPALAATYRARTDAARRALDAHDPGTPPEIALAAFAGVVEPAFGLFARDPGLPAELLPLDWPRAELDAVVNRAITRLAPTCFVYVQGLLAEVGHQPPR